MSRDSFDKMTREEQDEHLAEKRLMLETAQGDAAKTADASKRRFSLTSAKAVQAKEEHAEQLGANLDKLLQRREKADAKKAQRDFDDAWAVFAAEAEAAEAAKTEASEFGRA